VLQPLATATGYTGIGPEFFLSSYLGPYSSSSDELGEARCTRSKGSEPHWLREGVGGGPEYDDSKKYVGLFIDFLRQ
jgi:hypothetical protein